MRVYDRQERLVEAHINGRRDDFAVAEFFAYALEDQDVRVNRHTDGQNHAGDAGERQVAPKRTRAASSRIRLRINAITALTPEPL